MYAVFVKCETFDHYCTNYYLHAEGTYEECKTEFDKLTADTEMMYKVKLVHLLFDTEDRTGE